MKNLFKVVVMAVLVTACSTENHADFEKNTAAAKKYFELHQAEKSAEMFEMIHDDLSWHMPVYGSEMADAQGLKDALVNYQKEFDNMNFTADYRFFIITPVFKLAMIFVIYFISLNFHCWS